MSRLNLRATSIVFCGLIPFVASEKGTEGTFSNYEDNLRGVNRDSYSMGEDNNQVDRCFKYVETSIMARLSSPVAGYLDPSQLMSI
jgi:hypothetical protein